MSQIEMIKFKIQLFLKDVQIGWLSYRVARKKSRLAVVKIQNKIIENKIDYA